MQNLVKTLFSKSPKVLNIGSGPKPAKLSPRYDGMRQERLDIDPRMRAEFICDAREMRNHVERESFDAVFCAHNLEHYYHHEVPVVLSGMYYILKHGGSVEILVPDILAAIDRMRFHNADLEDTLYISPGGPIATIDVIYGWRLEISRSNQHFFAHKTAFTPKMLHRFLTEAGFKEIEIYKCEDSLELQALAIKP